MKNTALIRRCSMVLLLAFLMQCILPFFAVYDISAQAAGNTLAVNGKVLICSAEGFKWVSLSDLQDAPQQEHQSAYKCGVCYLAAHGTKDFIPAYANCMHGLALSHATMQPQLQQLHDGIASVSSYSRAPPVP
ncbi:MAG: hypothetical protein AB7L92_06130 [Alphaproteobacteria bacterium]